MEKCTAPFTSERREINILIVDDRPENLLTLESIIEREGRNIIKASGGNEALRISIREEIGLIMLDIQMPDIDGYEVATLLRSNNHTKHIPIIFVSAVTKDEKPSLLNFEEGTVDCLCKPLDLDETLSKVAIYEQLFHMRNERNEMAMKAEKLQKNLEQFVYIVSHDLKAPLRAIENLSAWISEDLSQSGITAALENLSLMQSRVQRMSGLLEGILDYSRSGRIEESKVAVNLNEMAHAVFESLTPPAGFKFDVGEMPVVTIERTRIYKVLYHLLKNAIMHHDDPANGEICMKCIVSDHKAIITISDNGTGIKFQYADKVFDMFTTLTGKDDKETTGVGLAICKQVLENAGQRIWLEQQQGTGASFSFTLPL